MINDNLFQFLQLNDVRTALANKDLDGLYKMAFDKDEALNLTKFFLMDLKINPLEYMSSVPPYFYGFDDFPVTTITIPKNITDIEERAFNGCPLEEVKFEFRDSEDLTFQKLCFNKCSHIKKFIFPEGTLSIGVRAFDYCTNLMEIELPKTLQKIEEDAFYFPSHEHKNNFHITYRGTMKEFQQISLGSFWIASALDIHCSDGVLKNYLY